MEENNATELMTLNDALMFLKNHIGQEWRDIGRNLDLTEGDLDHIHADNQGNAREICYQMLRKWKSKNGMAATVPILADALRNSGRKDLADKLVKEKNSVASSKKTQYGSSDVNRDTHVRDAERHKPSKSLAPGIFFILFAVAMVVFAYYVGPNTQDESRVMSERTSNRDELSKENVMEHDKLDSAINIVKNSLTKDWQDVGRSLGLSHPDIEHIREEHDRNPKERNYQMLQKWREKFGNQATLNVLKDALKKAGRQDLADKLPQEAQ